MGWKSRSSKHIFIWAALPFFAAGYLRAEISTRVLILNSYHAGYLWSDDELRGIETALSDPRIDLYIEFADSQRKSSPDYDAAFQTFLLAKYRAAPLNLILATDDYAVRLALKLRAALNLKVPIVFCGVNDYHGNSWIFREPVGAGLVGVLENVTYVETAQLVRTLLPATNEIVLLGPAADNDYAADLQRAFPGIRARYLHTRNQKLSDLSSELAELRQGSVVITAGFYSDVTGQPISMEASVRWVVLHTPVPVFGTTKRSLNWGIVGGKLADGFFLGKTAGEMARSLLNGTPVSDLTTVSNDGEPFVVNYSVLRRWNLDESRLLPGTIVVGRPVTLYAEHKQAVWAVVGFLLFQSLVIAFLTVEVKARKRTEEALLTTAQQYRAIFEQSPIGLVELALDGNWKMANDKAFEIIGKSRSDQIGGKAWQDQISPQDWDVVLQSRANLLKGDCTSFSAEIELLRKSGRKLWVQRTISLVKDAANVPKVFMVTLEDISRRKEAEQQLLRSNEALRHFAYAAAHDLQEPLRNVALTADFLIRDYFNHFDQTGQRLLKENVEGAQRMLGMVKALLAYSVAVDSADDGTACIVETEVALTVALQNLQAVLREANSEVVRSSLPAVHASEVHVVKLFQNLVGNAIKYRKKEGPLRVSVSAKPNGAEWIFEVADNGIGFESKYAERVFGVFKRLHSSRDYPGTGIGLAICARIVQYYGGRIWAESQPDAGARFFFSLPAVGPRGLFREGQSNVE